MQPLPPVKNSPPAPRAQYQRPLCFEQLRVNQLYVVWTELPCAQCTSEYGRLLEGCLSLTRTIHRHHMCESANAMPKRARALHTKSCRGCCGHVASGRSHAQGSQHAARKLWCNMCAGRRPYVLCTSALRRDLLQVSFAGLEDPAGPRSDNPGGPERLRD